MRLRYWPYLLFVSTLVIRLIGIGAESLWYDEAFTAQVVQLPVAKLIQATGGDVHPPAFYFIELLFVRILGNSEFVLRLPAALFSAAAVSELYLFVRQTTDHRSALWASGLSMFAAGLHYYGQEARQYSFLTWLVLLAVRSIMEDRKWRFAPAIGLAMYTHNLASIYLLPLAGLSLWKWRKAALLPLALAGTSYLPWLGVLMRQLGDVGNTYWIAQGNLGGLLYYWVYGTLGNRLPGWALFHSIATAMGVTVGSVFALRGNLKKQLPLLLLTFLPPVELYGISQVFQPLMLPRALLPSSAGLLGVWGLGLSRMTKQARTFAMLFLIPVMAVAALNYYQNYQVQRPPADQQVSIIETNWREGDVIYHASVGSVVGYEYYLANYPYYLMPGGDEIGGLSPLTREALGYTEHEANIDAVAGQYRRAFVVWSRSPTISDQQVNRAASILRRYPVIRRWTLVNTELATYEIALINLRGVYGSVQ